MKLVSSKSDVKIILLLCAAIFFIAPVVATAQKTTAKRGSAESEAILPQIDVIKVKESADEALRTANELRREIERLNARIIELDNRLILLSEDVSKVSSAKIEEVETRLALITEAYKDMHVKLQTIEIMVTPKPAPPPPPPPGKPPTFTTTSGGIIVASPEYDLYQVGLRHFNGRAYNKALETFNECALKFPDGENRDRVRYWIGECYYQMGNMEQAIDEYKKVFVYQNSSKADAAQFQIALAHQKLGQTEKARAEFRRLIERYPGSSFVERSKKYLADLK